MMKAELNMMDTETYVHVTDRVVFCVYFVYRQFVSISEWISAWNFHCSKHIRSTNIWISCVSASYRIQLRHQ